MNFEIVSGNAVLADLDPDCTTAVRIDIEVGRWHTYTTEYEGTVVEWMICHSGYSPSDSIDEFEMNSSVVIESGNVGLFDEIDFFPEDAEWLDNVITRLAGTPLAVLTRGVVCQAEDGVYTAFLTVNHRGNIQSIRIEF